MGVDGEAIALRPLPLADDCSIGFWEAAKRGHLAIQRCASCRRWNHAPGLLCPACGSDDMGFEDVSGKGSLFSWTIIKKLPLPASGTWCR